MADSEALARVASLLADPTRAEMLVILMDGRAFPVSDLAAYCHVSVPTASHHLAKLVDGGLVEVVRQGRHCYHRIADERIANLIEALGAAFDVDKIRVVPWSEKQQSLAYCRTCYKHLAGEIGVLVRQGLESKALVQLDNGRYQVTPAGASFLLELGLDGAAGLVGKVCLDWTERVPHIGGPLGSALYAGFLELGWFERANVPRQLRVTLVGSAKLQELLLLDPARLGTAVR